MQLSNTIRDRLAACLIAGALIVFAVDTGRLPRVHQSVWLTLYVLAALTYLWRAMVARPEIWLRAVSLSSLLFVTQMRAWVFFQHDGRLAPMALAAIITVFALRDRSLKLGDGGRG